MSISKKELKEKFEKEWKIHYNLDFFKEKGFIRKKCEKCGTNFWTIDENRKTCADSTCVGYEFIGEKTKKLQYVETWKETEKYFSKQGHTSIKRYPTVSRWRDDLYFTNASIIDFQPYVVNGEIEPPANPLIVPQTCIRFGDVNNVGVTGRHYTCFVMFGQHAFNTKKTGLFYWKEEAIKDNYNYVLKVLGAKEKDLVFQEDVWQGGGSFGPCIEYCCKGVELGNIVFMQYKDLGNGKYRELDTKVIDMGAGLERLAWFTNGSPTSYEITFNKTIKEMKKDTSIKVNEKLFTEYARLSGILSSDLKDYKKQKELIEKKIGAGKEFFSDLEKLHALYAIADHLKNILYTTNDGMLPSNSGGGYNLRMLLRRVFAFNEEFSFGLDYGKIIENHAISLKELDEEIKDGIQTAIEITEEEEKKYNSSKIKAEKKLNAVIQKAKRHKRIESTELLKLYESNGIAPETVKELAEKKGIHVEIPQNFYQMLAKEDEIEKSNEREFLIKYPKTFPLYYEDRYLQEFQAKVLGKIERYLILDKTAFYPEGGGQKGDTGEINGIKVLDTQQQNGVIMHEMQKIEGFKKGMTVIGKIDWQKRHNIMKHHTAAHILNAAAREVLGNHIWQGGSKKEENKAHLDLTHFKKITPEELNKIELTANKIIQESIQVENFVLERNLAEQKFGFRLYQGGAVPGKELRIVEIKGYDVEACGGTHVKNTGEIGLFKIIKREGIKDGIERITYTVGLNAIEFMQRKENELKKTAELLSTQESKVSDSVKRIFNEWKQLRKQANRKGSELKKGITIKNPAGRNFIAVDGTPKKAMISLADELAKENPQGEFILINQDEILVIEGKNSGKKANETLKEIFLKTQGKGGGTEKLARGKIANRKALNEITG
jgi:alanyl-tRNA synthetase